eukprot:10803499-Karenia_brevis.AAC.1
MGGRDAGAGSKRRHGQTPTPDRQPKKGREEGIVTGEIAMTPRVNRHGYELQRVDDNDEVG